MDSGLKTRNTFVYFILSITLFLLFFTGKKELFNFEEFVLEDDFWMIGFWLATVFAFFLFVLSMAYILSSIKFSDGEDEVSKKKAESLFKWCFILFLSFSVSFGTYIVLKSSFEPEKTKGYSSRGSYGGRGGSGRGGYSR